MNQHDKLFHVQTYLVRLAHHHEDPVGGGPLPADSAGEDPEVRRILSHAADDLGHAWTSDDDFCRRAPFALSDQQRAISKTTPSADQLIHAMEHFYAVEATRTVRYPDDLREDLQGMERLSQGLHPITGAPLAAQDPLGQEELRECFAFAATTLQRSLAAGYYTARTPFTLPRELWDRLPICEEPVSMTHLMQNVNSLVCDPTAVEGVSVNDVSGFLAEQGLLESVRLFSGRREYRPTEKGKALGIVETEVTGEHSSYTRVVYSPQAQRYLAEHMGELIEYVAW